MTKRDRKSPQRDLVLQIISRHGGHLNVDEIFKMARMKMPKISLGTVYRNLGALEEIRGIMSMAGPNNVTFYEIYSDPHHHFICEKCEGIENLESPGVHMCVKCIESHKGAKIERVLTTIYGVCKKCLS